MSCTRCVYFAWSSAALEQWTFYAVKIEFFGSKVVYFEVLAPVFCWRSTILAKSQVKKPIPWSWYVFMSGLSFTSGNLYLPKSSVFYAGNFNFIGRKIMLWSITVKFQITTTMCLNCARKHIYFEISCSFTLYYLLNGQESKF